MRKREIVLIIAALCICAAYRRHSLSQNSRIACLAMSTADSVYTQSMVESIQTQLEKNEYKVQVVYCENDISTQLNKIQDFIAMNASIIVVDCVGDSEAYTEVIQQAWENGIHTMMLNGDGAIEHANVQMLSSSLYKGICADKMVKEYLDKQYPNAAEGSIDVLLLGLTNNSKNLQATAGCQLLSERFIRYYDTTSVSFIRYEKPNQVYYMDRYGQKQEVMEPVGGLILDENGCAIENPYFDARVNLILAPNLNTVTNLEGQNAIDTHLTHPEGENIAVVIAMSGDAGVGAAERLMYYQSSGVVDKSRDDLAVFGTDDTDQNWSLLKASYTDNSLLRGFTGDFGNPVQMNLIMKALIKGTDQIIMEGNSFFTRMTSDGRNIGTATLVESTLLYLGIFDGAS